MRACALLLGRRKRETPRAVPKSGWTTLWRVRSPQPLKDPQQAMAGVLDLIEIRRASRVEGPAEQAFIESLGALEAGSRPPLRTGSPHWHRSAARRFPRACRAGV